MTDRELIKYALNTLIVHQGLTRPLQITGDCIEKLQEALAQPEPIQVRPAEFIAAASIGVGADVIGMPMIWAEWPTPESSTVKWSIPVDPNNFGEPIEVLGHYAGEGKVVNASFGLPKGAFEFAPYAGKGEASKIKHSLDPMPGKEHTACGYDETVGMCTNNPCCEQEPVSHLWECIGRWSAYLVANGKQGNLAPPEWLVDAVKAATAPPRKLWQEPVGQFVGGIPEVSQQREWVGLTNNEIDTYAQQNSFSPDKAPKWFTEVCRDIESRLKELNT